MNEYSPTRTAVAAAADRRELRFVVIGGLNTALSLAVYSLLYWLFGDTIHYMGALVLSYMVGIATGFTMHRRLVFQVRGRLLGDFVRFSTVQLGGFALNAALLPLLVEVAELPVVPAQIVATGLTVIATYFGHALFSFSRD